MSSAADPAWLTSVPKVELHLHLEGSMSVDTVRTLTERHGADPTRVWPQGIPDTFSFVDFPDFGRQFFYGLSLLRSGDDLATITDDLAATLAGQNVRYAEITTTAYTHFLSRGGHRLSETDYRDGLNEGRRRARARGVEIGWVIDIPRDLERPDSTVTIDYLEGPNTPSGLVGIGLGGYEVGFPAAPYADHFARATALGLQSLPHAGETEGAASIRSALDDLGAVRIGHGVRCLEDPALVARLADEGVLLEVSLTSNRLIGVVDDLARHPLPELLAAGVRVCLNTDDPGWFATDLVTELALATRHFGLDRRQHAALLLDALDASFASPELKTSIRSELRDSLAS
ncbi:MAG: adenosine deaminase [Acidimicrobiales bacterium]